MGQYIDCIVINLIRKYMNSYWNLFLLFLKCVSVLSSVCFQHTPGEESSFILNINECYQYLPSSSYYISTRNFLLLQCGEQSKTESSAVSHQTSSYAKECREIMGGVLLGCGWSGCCGWSPASRKYPFQPQILMVRSSFQETMKFPDLLMNFWEIFSS